MTEIHLVLKLNNREVREVSKANAGISFHNLCMIVS